VSKESTTEEEPKVYSQTPIQAMTPMMTVARTGVLNLESVLPDYYPDHFGVKARPRL
jgi:hypothetical protein